MTPNPNRQSLVAAGLMLGIGLGGFVDGIVFHQLLQTHNLLSAKRPKDSLANVEINMFWDGLFHSFTWIATVIGVYQLWSAMRSPGAAKSGRTLLGAMLAGWGMFNLVEGVINHHLLHVHHVVERLGISIWDYVFLGSGVLLIVGGWGIIWSDRRRSSEMDRL